MIGFSFHVIQPINHVVLFLESNKFRFNVEKWVYALKPSQIQIEVTIFPFQIQSLVLLYCGLRTTIFHIFTTLKLAGLVCYCSLKILCIFCDVDSVQIKTCKGLYRIKGHSPSNFLNAMT
jgi:hypothetical protein